MMQRRSFTLLEIIIIIIIVGILAGLTLPQYLKTRENAVGKEAQANLKLIAAAERVYRLETGYYYPYAVSGSVEETRPGEINPGLKLDLDERNWDYKVTSSTVNDFTASARRQSGPYSSCQYSLEHDDDNGEPDAVAGTCP